MAMHRTILIGDVHGCLDELCDLARLLGLTRGDDVVFVGDLVAKGPDSLGVLQWAREHGARSVLGNHEAHLLRWQREGLVPGGKPLKEGHRRLAESMQDVEWRQLEAMPLWLDLDTHGALVVHGGLLPGVPLESQSREDLLNLRSITPEGRASKRVDDGVPWASLWMGPEHVVFGHDARRGLQQRPHATGLDSGCVYGRGLTALVLPERRLVQVGSRRQYVDPEAAP
jgi:hypothetical protein